MWMRAYSSNTKKWTLEIIAGKTGPFLYTVESDGKIHRRHLDQIRDRKVAEEPVKTQKQTNANDGEARRNVDVQLKQKKDNCNPGKRPRSRTADSQDTNQQTCSLNDYGSGGNLHT